MRYGLGSAFICFLLASSVAAAPEASRPTRAARAFVDSLSTPQRSQVLQPFDSADRWNWHYVPRSRRGLALGRMTADQQARARALLQAVIGERGARKAEEILGLEGVLQQALPAGTRRRDPTWRSPGLYHVAIFGPPSAEGAWGVRFEGHHLSVNATIARDAVVSTTPLFFGASPSQARDARGRALRPLGPEEQLARALVSGLGETAARYARVSRQAPGDIRLGPQRPAGATGRGTTIAALSPASRARFWTLVEAWTSNTHARISASALATLRATDPQKIRFAWEGSTKPGLAHAYTIEAPSAVFEYVNRGNHIHAVWRAPDGDFGR